MPFTFQLYQFADYSDPDTIFGGSENTSSGSVGSTFTFNSGPSAAVTADAGPDDGGEPLTDAVTLNGTNYSPNDRVEAEYEVIMEDPNTGLYYRITGIQIDGDWVGVTSSLGWDATTGQYVAGTLPDAGMTLTALDGDDLDGTPNAGDFLTDNNYSGIVGNDATALDQQLGAPVCFGHGTMIMTQKGFVAVQDLQPGDMIETRDDGFQPLRWIGARKLSAHELAMSPQFHPIRIDAGALARGVPSDDLIVSPQHRMLMQSPSAELVAGEAEILIAAKRLVVLDGIAVANDLQDVTYYHLLFNAHQIVTANGAASESLHTGAEALNSLEAVARDEILALFPELAEMDHGSVSCRRIITGPEAQTLAMMHAQSGAPLIAVS